MSVYFITYYMPESSYTNHKHTKNYEDSENIDFDLVCRIESLGRWAHFMPTSYLISTSLSADEILNFLSPSISNRDLLFISKVDLNNVACVNPQVKEWILKVQKN